jgi:Type I phosphodiesterase / nucleotide pyrophosphatase
MTLTGDCDPDCDMMRFSMIKSVPYITVTLPGPMPCLASPHVDTFTVEIAPNAPLGPIFFEIFGKTPAAECSWLVMLTVRNVDLIFGGVLEDQEEFPGGLICVNNDDDDNTARADKDDDPGPILGENDLKPLTLSLNGLDPGGTGTLTLIQGSGGQVRVYENEDRSVPVPLIPPLSFSGNELPKMLHVEGYKASSVPRDVEFEFAYTTPDGELCKDIVKISVGGVEFKANKSNEFTGSVHRKMDLINLLNPNPLVQLDMNSLPSTGASVVFPITGKVTSRIAPLTTQDVTVNGLPVQSLQLISSGSDGFGPFEQIFSRNITLPDHDLLIKAKATNTIGNSGSDKRVVIADLDCSIIPSNGCSGAFLSRSVRDEQSTPVGAGNVEWFSIEVIDPLAEGDEVTVEIDTGVEQKTLQLARVQNSILFRQKYIHLVPENLSLPSGTEQEIVDTRIKGKLGAPVRATYLSSDRSTWEDKALTVGIMFVAASDGQPVDVALAGLPKDVADGGINRNPLNMIAGLPGDSTYVDEDTGRFKLKEPKLIARDYRDDSGTSSQTLVDLFRVSDDPASPDFNLFLSDPAAPLLPLASEEFLAPANPSLTVRGVQSGGFLRLEYSYEFGTIQTVEPVRGPIVVNVLVDGLGAGFPQASFAPAVPPNFQTMLAAGLLPNFAKLIGVASHSVQRFDGLTTFPSITYSAWSSWVTGKDPGIHGVTGSNFFRRDRMNDQYWCGLTPDPTCDGTGGMWPPADHVSFHGPEYPIADLDIKNVWSSIGTLNSAIRPDVATLTGQPNILTLYEALATKGIRSAVVYHFAFRGAADTRFPSILEGLRDHDDKTGTGLDDGATVELLDLLDPSSNASHIRPPQVLTVYYAGLDTNAHNNANYLAFGATHLIRTDRYLGTLVRLLEQWNLMNEAMFTFTGDHGLTYVVEDDTHSLLLETLADKELEAVFDALNLDVLDSANPATECDPVCGFDAVVTLNGGMAHVYLRDSVTNEWASPPSFVQDVLPVAKRFYDNTVGTVIDELELLGSIELILVRDATGTNGFKSPYLVVYKTGITEGKFGMLSPLDALSFSIDGVPLISPGYVDFVANIERLRDIRSGDIILLSNYSKKHRNLIAPFEEGDPQGRDGGYYFGGELDSWHGSLYDTDMTIPIVFSCPRCGDNETTQYLNTVNSTLPQAPATAKINDIAPTVFKALTEGDLP